MEATQTSGLTQTATEYLKQFKHLRDDYSDKLPETRVHSQSENRTYKCRSGIRNTIFLTVESAVEDGCLDPTTLDLFAQTKDYFHVKGRRTRMMDTEDIRKLNELLQGVIKDLEGRV